MARVLFFLPTISGYRDRVRLLMEVSNGLDRLDPTGGEERRGPGYGWFRTVSDRGRGTPPAVTPLEYVEGRVGWPRNLSTTWP